MFLAIVDLHILTGCAIIFTCKALFDRVNFFRGKECVLALQNTDEQPVANKSKRWYSRYTWKHSQLSNLTPEEIRGALQVSGGRLTAAARLLGVSVRAFSHYVYGHPDLYADVKAMRKAVLELADFRPELAEFKDIVARYQGDLSQIAAHYGQDAAVLAVWLERHPDYQLILNRYLRSAQQLAELAAATFKPPDMVEFVNLLAEHNGNLAALAAHYQVPRHQIKELLERDETLYRYWLDTVETRLDMAEAALHAAVLRNEAWAVRFLLSTRGRLRGYVTRGELISLNVKLQDLSIEQLQRLAAGEHPAIVLGDLRVERLSDDSDTTGSDDGNTSETVAGSTDRPTAAITTALDALAIARARVVNAASKARRKRDRQSVAALAVSAEATAGS